MAYWGGTDGPALKALASHQRNRGSSPVVNAICGLSLFMVPFSAPRAFSLGIIPVFLQKVTF